MSAPLDTDEQVIAELDAIDAARAAVTMGDPLGAGDLTRTAIDFWQRHVDLDERAARCWARAAELAVDRGASTLERWAMLAAADGCRAKAAESRRSLADQQRRARERERVQ